MPQVSERLYYRYCYLWAWYCVISSTCMVYGVWDCKYSICAPLTLQVYNRLRNIKVLPRAKIMANCVCFIVAVCAA